MGLPHCSQSHLGVIPGVKGWPGSSEVLVGTEPNSRRRGLLSVLPVVSVRMGTEWVMVAEGSAAGERHLALQAVGPLLCCWCLWAVMGIVYVQTGALAD